MQTSNVHPAPHEVHIVVEVDGKNKPVTLDHADVTGREIRTVAGAPLTGYLPDARHSRKAVGRQHRARREGEGPEWRPFPRNSDRDGELIMTPDFIAGAARELEGTYGTDGIRVAADGPRTLVRISEVELLRREPRAISMLLVLDPSQPKPVAYVRPGQLLANGADPRSTSLVMTGGNLAAVLLQHPVEERRSHPLGGSRAAEVRSE